MLETRTNPNFTSITSPRAVLGLAFSSILLAACSVGAGADVTESRGVFPTQDTYEPCITDAECITDECWDITVEYSDATITDAMCTYGCSGDLDCDYGGLCLQISGERPLCYQPCRDDLDCFDGFACIVDDFGFDPVCLPY